MTTPSSTVLKTCTRGFAGAALALFATTVLAAPVVSLTSPAANAKFTPPASVTLTATATDTASTISKVEFFQGGTNLIGTVTTAPYTFNWTNVATGAYSLTAKATSASGATRVSAARNILVNTAPTVSLTSPSAGTSFYGLATINLTVNAADSDGSIAKVQYFKGGTLIGTVTTAPFAFTWSAVAPGSYSLTAKATDNLGAVTASPAVAITVKNPIDVAITAPATNAKFSSPGNVTFTADAVTHSCDTCNAPVTKVDFYAGPTASTTSLIGTATTVPYTFNWTNAPAGKYVVKAIATDPQGLTNTSKTITITVNNPPTVTITSPATGATYLGLATIPIVANIADADGSVTKVQFLKSGAVIANLTGPPYAYNWTNVAPGSYNLTVKATDNLGGVTTSSAVAVTVTNPVTVAFTTPVNKDRYIPGTPISLTATTSEANTSGTPPPAISDVTYYAGTNTSAPLIGASTTAPYEVIWNNVPIGIYNIIAVATDTQGIAKTSTLVKITVDTTPDVSVTAPAANSAFALGSTITLAATAQNPSGASITKVEFRAKGKLVATVTSPPYTTAWTPTVAGNYAITAKATDSLNVSTTSTPVNVGIVNGSAPSVAITSPATNALYLNAPATIDITAAASTLTGTLTKVEFFKIQNNVTTSIGLGTLTSGSNTGGTYKLTWNNVAAGTYTISSVATNSVNLTATADPVIVTVDAAPVLNWTSPAANALYQAGDNIPLTATATDSDGTIAKVDFYTGTVVSPTLIGTVTSGSSGTYTFNWSSVAAGSFSLFAIATDNLGATTTTTPIGLTVNAPPTASWTAPSDGQVYPAGANVTLTVNATDSDGTIAKVDFYNGQSVIGTVNSGQSGNSGNNFSLNWNNVAGGTYTLNAIATDSSGGTANAGSIGIVVNTAPTITLTGPSDGSTQPAPATITLTATATDSDGTIGQVDFYQGTAPNATLVGSVQTGQNNANGSNSGSSYTLTLTNQGSGSYAFYAVATDNNSASSTSSSANVTVNALPTASLTAPASNSTAVAGTNLTLTASAADSDGSIAKVEFYNGVSLIGTVLAGGSGDTGNGYTFTLNNLASGTYTLTAKAYDNLGAITTSSAVTLTVGAAVAGIYYIHPDHLGTPRAITKATDNTKVWEWSNAEPFGNNDANENPSGAGNFEYNLRFPGQYRDKETATNYNYFRDYDPSTGRYVQSDPIGVWGLTAYSGVIPRPQDFAFFWLATRPPGSSHTPWLGSEPSDIDWPRSDPTVLAFGLSTYAYVDGSPLRFIDPYGETKKDPWFGRGNDKGFKDWWHQEKKHYGNVDIPNKGVCDELYKDYQDSKERGKGGKSGKGGQSKGDSLKQTLRRLGVKGYE